ncbi:YesL family protein [Blautia sp. HCP28S3_G10]|uniref:YesL family protein n=1 Tax=Blautia sp. HCP28S3_G10 TaxID=3438908 RepID=UPI003F8C98AF
MGRLFDMDNKFFRFMGRLADLCILNVLCILCCIPVVTAGASITAMFYVTMKMVRNEEAYIARSFFKSFKENFRQATVINIIMLVIAGVLYVDFRVAKSMPGTASTVFQYLFLIFAILYVMLFTYIYPVLAKFYNSIKNTFRNAILMSVRHLPYTVLMIIVSICPVLVFYIQSARAQSMLLLLLIMVGFALVAYINSFFFVKIFDRYIIQEPEEKSENAEEVQEAGGQN